MLSSIFSSLHANTLQLSAAQAGRVTNVTSVSFFEGDGVFYAPEIKFEQGIYGEGLPPPKSGLELLREQMDLVMDPLRQEYEDAGDALRMAWREAIARGEMEGNPDSGIHQMRQRAKRDGDTLPAIMRDLIQQHETAQRSLIKLQSEGFRMIEAAGLAEAVVTTRETKRLINQAVIDIVDSRLASEVARGAGGLDSARTALQLVRMIRGIDDADMAEQQERVAALGANTAYAALQSRRNEMIADFHRRIEAGEIGIVVSSVSAWGDVEASVEMPTNALSSIRVSQGYHMVSVSLSFSTSGGLISTRA
ncbi:MAG TPA: hypothetical protein PLI13_09090 [Paracoccus sp. (in: a-proteobacteria)]|nr:hypothetical protein [Paracoccus sp. (in: a-proteobacteria)]